MFISNLRSNCSCPSVYLEILSILANDISFTVEISDFDGEVVAVRDYTLHCNISDVNCFDSLLVELPIHKTDLLTFSLYLDGVKQGQIKLPVKVVP